RVDDGLGGCRERRKNDKDEGESGWCPETGHGSKRGTLANRLAGSRRPGRAESLRYARARLRINGRPLMKIAVCMKEVPDASATKRIDPQTLRLDRGGGGTLNEFDTHALEEALKLKES